MRARNLGLLRGAAPCAAILGTFAAFLAPAGAHATVSAAPGAPAACSGVQITDALGDGHHPNTDLTAAWFTQAGGALRVVLVNDDGFWQPAHDDSPSAGWAVLWRSAGATRFVRLEATQSGQLTYDAGTWTRAGGFASTGPTTGEHSPTGPDGWVAIDVPASAGAVPGAILASPFALTYDGMEGSDLHWVDRAPGGSSPDDSDVGADYVVAPCPGAPIPSPTTVPGTVDAGGSPTSTGVVPGLSASLGSITGVTLEVPTTVLGARSALAVRGSVSPARSGVDVVITATARGRTRQFTATTDARGAYVVRGPITEHTQLRATASGLSSQLATVQVKARVRITVRRTRSGGALVTGRVSPALPGRVLWLRQGSVTESAATRTSGGRFTFRLKRPVRGRYEALVLPANSRAERGLSNTGVIR